MVRKVIVEVFLSNYITSKTCQLVSQSACKLGYDCHQINDKTVNDTDCTDEKF